MSFGKSAESLDAEPEKKAVQDFLLQIQQLLQDYRSSGNEGIINPDSLLLRGEDRKNATTQIESFRACADNVNFNRRYFAEQLVNLDTPLELIWRLHVAGFVNPHVIFFWSPDNYVSDVVKRLSWMLLYPSAEQRVLCEEIIGDMLAILTIIGYDKTKVLTIPIKMQQKYREMLDDVILPIFDAFLTDLEGDGHETNELASFKPVDPYSVLNYHLTVDPECLRHLCIHQMTLLLRKQSSLSLEKAFEREDDLCYKKCNISLVEMMKEIIKILQSSDIQQLLNRTTAESSVCLPILLIFVSVFVAFDKNGPAVLKEEVSKLLETAFTNVSREALALSFLLARHASAENQMGFPTYSEWFRVTFGSERASHATDVKSFTFLTKCLTELVPLQPIEVLRTHVNHRPYIPSGCVSVWSDYSTLAKTRLFDLRQQQIKTPAVSSASKDDVERTVTLFKTSGKIPDVVHQNFVFKKQYFLQTFLPELLQPRPLPEVPDDKMQFICALLDDGKISDVLYKKYLDGCSVELAKLLEGAFADDEDNWDNF